MPHSIQKIALRKLILFDNANSLLDLKNPPENHLEVLNGKRTGQYSIRINDQWRICFTPINGGADYKDVEIVGYH